MTGLVRLLRGHQSGGMPGIVIAWELIPWRGGGWGGGDWGRHCSSFAWSGAWQSFLPLTCGQRSCVGAIISSARLAGIDCNLLYSAILYLFPVAVPSGGVMGGGTAAVLPGLKLSIPFILACSTDSAHMLELIV